MNKIKEAARDYAEVEVAEREFINDYEKTSAIQPIERAFCDGAEFALNHLWHDARVETPDEDGKYLVIQEANPVRPSKFNDKICVRSFRNGSWIWTSRSHITHWMPIPELNNDTIQ